MKRFLRLLVVLSAARMVPGVVSAQASSGDEVDVWKTWKELSDQTWDVWTNPVLEEPKPNLKAPDAMAVAKAGAPLKLMLRTKNLNEWTKQHIEDQKVDFVVAMAWVNQKDGERAYHAFVDANAVDQGIPLIEDSREPFYFAQDVFRLHAQIIDLNRHADPVPQCGYQFYALPRTTGGFEDIFIYGTDNEVERDQEISDVAKHEQRKLIYLLEPGEKGDYTTMQHVEVIAARRDFKAMVKREGGVNYVILKGVKKYIEFTHDADPFASIHRSPASEIKLRIENGKLQAPVDAIAEAASGHK